MKRYVRSLTVYGMLLLIPVAAWCARVYSLNIGSASVTVIDPATNEVVHTITGIPWPRGASFSPDGTKAYICSEEEHTLNVVDTNTFEIVKKIHLKGHPSGSLVITTDGRYVLVPKNPFYGLAIEHKDPADSGGVDVVDMKSFTVVKSLPIKPIHDLFISPDGKYAIAGSAITNVITVIDLKSLKPVRTITPDDTPLTMIIERASDGSSGRIFTEIKHYNGFEVIDFKTGKKLDKIEFPDPVKFRFAALKNTLGAKDLKPTEYNPTHGTDITPDGKTLWITSRGTNYVYIYSLPDLRLMNHIFLPSREVPGRDTPETGDPHWIVITPDGKTAYICLAHFKTAIAIDVKTMKEVAQIPVGAGAKMIHVSALP